MTTILRFLQVFSLGTWIGAILFITFLLAPGAFASMPTRQLAGAVVGMALTRLHFLGYAAGAIFLACSAFLLKGGLPISRIAVVAVVLMMLLTAVSEHGVTPKIVDLRAKMQAEHGGVDNTPRDSPLRSEFGKLHGVSTSLELLVLLLGLAALFLALRAQNV